MGIFDALAGVAGAGINAWSQANTNRQNEALMRESWARDDNAVQRRAADLEAAGMNPLLAAGAPAQSGSPIQLKAPEYGNMVTGALEGAQAGKSIEQTQAQTDLIKANARKADAEAKMMEGTFESPTGQPVTWAGTEITRRWAEASEAGMKALLSRYKNDSGILTGEVDLEKKRQDFMMRHQDEIMEAEKELKTLGLKGAKLENARKEWINKLLEKDFRWYTADKALGVLGAAGSAALKGSQAARMIVAPW